MTRNRENTNKAIHFVLDHPLDEAGLWFRRGYYAYRDDHEALSQARSDREHPLYGSRELDMREKGGTSISALRPAASDQVTLFLAAGGRTERSASACCSQVRRRPSCRSCSSAILGTSFPPSRFSRWEPPSRCRLLSTTSPPGCRATAMPMPVPGEQVHAVEP